MVPGPYSARNGIDLGEGTELTAGKSGTAQLFCSVPKSQVNVDAFVASSTWTMNTNDPTMGKQDIMFVCDAVAEQLGPRRANEQGRYRYIGCFKENNPGRQLSTQLYGAEDNENGKCMNGCAGAAGNFIFAGTQYHRECWCGNTIPIQRVDGGECNFDCSGLVVSPRNSYLLDADSWEKKWHSDMWRERLLWRRFVHQLICRL